MKLKKLFLFLTIFFICILQADIEIFDDDSVPQSEDFIDISEDEEWEIERTAKGKLHMRGTLESHSRFVEKTGNFREMTRLNSQVNSWYMRLFYETNTIIENSKYPFGGSITYKPNRTQQLVIGQYQISTGYGLTLAKNSYISERPGFNTNFTQNRTSLSSNARPYFSQSFFGAAYQMPLNENLSFLIHTSHKEIGARLNDEAEIVSLLPHEKTPKYIVFQSIAGGIVNFNTKNISLSSNVYFEHFDHELANKTNPLTSSIAGSYKYDNYLFFTETAVANDRFAHLSGVKNNHNRFSQILLYRYFEPGYNADFSNFVSNSSTGENEQAVFYQIGYRNSDFSVKTYADIFANIENQHRYRNKNTGGAWGIAVEKYSLFDIDDQKLHLSYREKKDKEWRNFTGIANYEDRTRRYYRVSWTQIETKFLTTRFIYDYQTRDFPTHAISQNGYTICSNLTMRWEHVRISTSLGIFDTEIPMYLYLFSGRANNSMYILNGDGHLGVISVSAKLHKRLSIETMALFLNKAEVERIFGLYVKLAISD
jgi:hypothetical protein